MSISSIRRPACLALLGVFLSLLLNVAFAQDEDDDPSNDPPDRVARLSFTQGSVSLEPAGAEEWTPATVNRPLTGGDKIWVDAKSRAELQTDSATLFLDQNTAFSFTTLNDDITQVRITGGALNVRLRRLGEHESVEIDTPNAAVTLTQPGEYHIAINDVGDATVVKVRSGESEVAKGSENFAVHANQQATFTGTDRLSADTRALGAFSSFEEWAHDRAVQDERAKSTEYVAEEVVGHEDLDDNGSWSSEPEYGEVWYPTRVAVDWAPYRFGHWVWVAPWGWTWVDNAPWGFAPFHYGRWAHVRDRWCWVPGPRHARPVYAPALVGWVGGPGVSVAVSVGSGPGIGWFPLAPREVYVPSYRVSRRYVRNVNLSNTTVINNTYITNVYENRVANVHYANRDVPRGVTVVQRDTFTRGRPVSEHLERVDGANLRTLHGRDELPRVAPVRESTLGDRSLRAQTRVPPAQIYQRPAVARIQPSTSEGWRNSSRGRDRNEANATPSGSAPNIVRPNIPRENTAAPNQEAERSAIGERRQNHMYRENDNPNPSGFGNRGRRDNPVERSAAPAPQQQAAPQVSVAPPAVSQPAPGINRDRGERNSERPRSENRDGGGERRWSRPPDVVNRPVPQPQAQPQPQPQPQAQPRPQPQPQPQPQQSQPREEHSERVQRGTVNRRENDR